MIPRTVPIVCARSKQPRGQSIAVRGELTYGHGMNLTVVPIRDSWRCACCGQRVKVTW